MSIYSILFIGIVFFIMVVFPSTLIYTLSLVISVITLVSFLVSHGVVSGLLALLVLLVYVGAMMVMVSYICAISPNMKYYTSLVAYIVVGLLMAFAMMGLFLPNFTPMLYVDSSVSSPSIFFSDVGLWFLLLLSLFMVLVLMYSTYISPVASSLRSFSRTSQ